MSEHIKRAKVVKIEVKRIVDEYPDISFLETTPEYHYGTDGSNWNHVSEEEKQKIIAQYGSILGACVAYAEQDKERLDAYNRGTWWMIGIKTIATVHILVNDNVIKTQTIDSGGILGIESDSDKSYLQEIGRNQIDEVKDYLRVLCVEDVDSCEIVNI